MNLYETTKKYFTETLVEKKQKLLPLYEKTMAALRHGVTTVIIPKDNERDLSDIDPVVRNALNFITAQTIDTVLAAALNYKTEMEPTILQNIPDEVKTKKRNTIRQ